MDPEQESNKNHANDHIVVESDSFDSYDDSTYESETSSMEESDEVDETRLFFFSADLSAVKVQRSKLLHLEQLQNLCIKNICHNLNYFSKQEKSFHRLAPKMLEILTRVMSEKAGLPSCPHLLPLVIAESSTFLNIECTEVALKGACDECKWDQQNMIKILRLIKQKCQAKLKFLELRLPFPSYLSMEAEATMTMQAAVLAELNNTLASLGGLVRLKLVDCRVNDETLGIIARNCHSLSDLDVANNKNITDRGVQHLCVGESRKTLTTLQLFSTAVSVDALFVILCSLPQLAILKHDKASLAVLKFMNSFPGKELKLEYISFGYEAGNKSEISNVGKCLKNIKSLDICGKMKLSLFHDLQKVEDLSLDCLSYNFQDLSSLLIKLGSNLSKLYLFNSIVNDFDVSIIGYHCTKLQEFYWKTNWNPRINCKYTLTQEHFSQLKKLEMTCMDKDYSFFPPQVLEQMLASPKLEVINIDNLDISGEILEALIEEARIYSTVFSNLHSLFIEQSRVSVSCLKEIVCLAPKLSRIGITNSRDREGILYNFIAENKLDIHLF